MSAVLTSLLFLGLSLGQKMEAQTGTLLKPTIWAEPGSTVMSWRPVTIWCQGSLEAMEYHLHREGSPVFWEKIKPLEPRNKAEFFIPQMTVNHAGRYRCSYASNTGLSALSEPLDLVMTGVYDKASLSALPGALPYTPYLWLRPENTLVSGENVTLQCTSSKDVDKFLLSKDGAAGPLMYMRFQYQGQRKYGTFTMSPVTLTDAGTYRCYASRHTSPYLLSHPSDSLEITVPELTDTESKTTAPSQNYWGGNCVRLGLSAVVLLILVVVLAEAGLDQCQSQHDSMGWKQDDAHQRT